MEFDHIGIAVPTIEEGRAHFQALLHISHWTTVFQDDVNRVSVQFGRDASGVCYEVIAPLGDDSPIHAALRRGQRILNHVAYRVADLAAEAQRMSAAGCVASGQPRPAIAYGMRHIQFFMTPLGVLMELIEAPGHAHQYVARAGS